MKLSNAREIALTAKRLRGEGFSVPALKKGLANSSEAATFEKVVRGEILGDLGEALSGQVPTYDEIW